MVLYLLPSSLQILILYHKKLQNVDTWKAKQKLLYAIQECTINKSRDLIYIITIFHSTEVWYTRCEPLPSLVDIIKCDVGHSFQYLDLEFPCRLGLGKGPCAQVLVVPVTGYSLNMRNLGIQLLQSSFLPCSSPMLQQGCCSLISQWNGGGTREARRVL